MWTSHRTRAKKDTALPDGVPDHIYSFPDMYGLEDCGMVMSHLYMLMHFTHMYSVLPCIHHTPELHVGSLYFCLTQLKCSSVHSNGVFHAAVTSIDVFLLLYCPLMQFSLMSFMTSKKKL